MKGFKHCGHVQNLLETMHCVALFIKTYETSVRVYVALSTRSVNKDQLLSQIFAKVN